MPNYVCPECGVPVIDRAVLINGTLMHYDPFYLRVKTLNDYRAIQTHGTVKTSRSRVEARS